MNNYNSSDEDELSSEEIELSSNNEVTTYLQVGSKRVRLSVHIEDADSDELEDYLMEDMMVKAGLHPRSIWMHSLNLRRPVDGEFVRICVPFREHADRFFQYFRMSIGTFDYILRTIEKDIVPCSNRSYCIMPAERLSVALRYLSTGMTFQAVAQSFLMDKYTVGIIVKEVCQSIYTNLVQKHMPVPSKDEFQEIAKQYEEQWQFPNVLGALDGKHVRMKCPRKSGSMYFNYKLYYSILMQAVSDSNYKFIFVDVGSFGRESDGGAFEASNIKVFMNNADNFPKDRLIPGFGNRRIPYLFVADDAYPLQYNIMKPYSHRDMTREQMIFNGRLSRARRCVECSFGILANKWRLLLKPIETTEHTACIIVKCLTVLHNVVIDQDGISDLLLKSVQDKIKANELTLGNFQTGRKYNRSATEPIQIRNLFTKYFNSPAGEVPWQERYVK